MSGYRDGYLTMRTAWSLPMRDRACCDAFAEATMSGPRPPDQALVGSRNVASTLRPPEEAPVGSRNVVSTLRPPEEAPVGSSYVASTLRSSVGAARSCCCSTLPPGRRNGPLLTELTGSGNRCCYRWAPPPGVSCARHVLARVSFLGVLVPSPRGKRSHPPSRANVEIASLRSR